MFSDPVVGPDFYGREDVLEILKKRVEAFENGYRQNVALIGRQKLGKSSVLHEFLRGLGGTGIVPVYVELKPYTLQDFADQFIRSLLFEYLRRKESIRSMESYEVLARLARAFIPATVAETEKIFEEASRGDAEAAFTRLFELSARLHKESGVRSIVILDEFHRLGDFGPKNAFQNFGRRIMLQKNTLYLLSSSSFTVSKLILAEKLSLLFGNFERVYLEPFTFEVSARFLVEKLKPVTLPEPFQKYLISLTNGHPFYLNVLASKCREVGLAQNSPHIDRFILVKALKELLFDSEGVLNQYFLNLVAKWRAGLKGDHLKLILLIASSTNKLKGLSAALGKSPRETSRQLKELTDSELVLKNGVFFHLHDKLFQFWMRVAYRSRELSLVVDMPSKAAEFRLEAERDLDQFLTASREPAQARLLDLMRSFRNEIVEFDSKGRQLPQFNEIRTESGEPDFIIARSSGQSWVLGLLESRTTEKEIQNFIRRTAHMKERNQKRVLVTLSGMDHNARLLAKNKRIWTLNLQKVNTLMDFYGLSKVVTLRPFPI